jgi:hypothetical protein
MPQVCEVAAHPTLVAKLKSALGPDILLWGVQFVRQRPRGTHRWHVDVESVKVNGLAAWIALKNVAHDACLQLIPGSHRFGVSPQELARGSGLDLGDDSAVLSAAHGFSPEPRIVPMGIGLGQGFLFNPKIWHGSRNLTRKTRFAMILHYARPGDDVRIPLTYSPPQPIWASSSAPCVLISGQDRHGTSFLIEPASGNEEQASARWHAAYRRTKNVVLTATRTVMRRFGPLWLEDRLIARRFSRLEANWRKRPNGAR